MLLNDPQYVEAARKIGERSLREGGKTPDERFIFMFRLLTSRRPTAGEMTVLRRLYEGQLVLFKANPEGAAALVAVGATKPDAVLNPVELAASTALASTLLSFDEAIQKR